MIGLWYVRENWILAPTCQLAMARSAANLLFLS